jgi:hypothetical protein
MSSYLLISGTICAGQPVRRGRARRWMLGIGTVALAAALWFGAQSRDGAQPGRRPGTMAARR